MKLLAFDTSTTACTAALGVAGRVIERHEVREREHTRILVPMLRELMTEGGVDYRDLDAIVLGNGPGSFIGMRIAASLAQGLGFAAGLPVVPVSSLAALAARAFAGSAARHAVVAQDARMEQVYLGLYRRGADDLPEPLGDERLHAQLRVSELDALGALGAVDTVAVGGGWRRYPALLAANEDLVSFDPDCRYPRAADLLTLGARAWRHGEWISPDAVSPAYLRLEVAVPPAARTP